MDSQEPRPASPGYLHPTVASTLPPYFHIEAERIANSFRSVSQLMNSVGVNDGYSLLCLHRDHVGQ
jgi:hypothetical protein